MTPSEEIKAIKLLWSVSTNRNAEMIYCYRCDDFFHQSVCVETSIIDSSGFSIGSCTKCSGARYLTRDYTHRFLKNIDF